MNAQELRDLPPVRRSEPDPIHPIRMPKPTTLLAILLGVAISPLVCSEALYRHGLSQLELPALPARTVPPLVAEAAWVLAGHPGPRVLRSGAPWTTVLLALPLAALRRDKSRPKPEPDYLAARLLALDSPNRPRGQTRRDLAPLRQTLLWDSLATWLRRHATADQAITLWLSREYFGHGVRGLDAAAAKVIGKPVEALDAEEVARLLALTQYPGIRDRPPLWKERRDQLLRGLQQRGTIDAKEAALAIERPLPTALVVGPAAPPPSETKVPPAK